MTRRAACCLVVVALACAAAPFAPGQDAAKPAPEPKSNPAYVYRTVTNLTATNLPARSAEGEREHWSLVSSFLDSTNANTPTGIFRRKYVVLKADKEPLKSLQGTWNATFLAEYGRERIAKIAKDAQQTTEKPPSLTLKFENNGFTFTQAGPSKRQYTQVGTVQYAQAEAGAFYDVDFLIESETRDEQATPPPYTTVRALVTREGKTLIIVTNGSSGDRPATDSTGPNKKLKNAVYSEYEPAPARKP